MFQEGKLSPLYCRGTGKRTNLGAVDSAKQLHTMSSKNLCGFKHRVASCYSNVLIAKRKLIIKLFPSPHSHE